MDQKVGRQRAHRERINVAVHRVRAHSDKRRKMRACEFEMRLTTDAIAKRGMHLYYPLGYKKLYNGYLGNRLEFRFNYDRALIIDPQWMDSEVALITDEVAVPLVKFRMKHKLDEWFNQVQWFSDDKEYIFEWRISAWLGIEV